jgi:CubicO group peptidase (beta-lactamase class C family)
MSRYLLVLCSLLITYTVQAANGDSSFAKLNSYFSTLAEQQAFNGNVLIARNGSIILDQSYNLRDQPTALHVDSSSKFIIASVSKIFVKYAILKLCEKGDLKLSDRLNHFIPDFPRGAEITIEHLIFHTSGLPRELRNYESYDSLSLQQSILLAANEKLLFEPGSDTSYSNVGYLILHYIIDKVGKGYLDFMEKEVVQKYELRSTGELNSSRSVSGLALGFTSENGVIQETDKITMGRFETGNFYSTTNDLYQFSNVIYSGKVLDRKFAIQLFKGDSLLEQAGGRPGYRSYYYQNLKSGLTFIFLCNYTEIPFQNIIADVVSIADNKPVQIPIITNRKSIIVSDSLLALYTGKFALVVDQTQVFKVTLVDNQLRVTDKDNETISLLAENETTFFDDPRSKDSISFLLNPGTGKYEMILISSGIKLKTNKLE